MNFLPDTISRWVSAAVWCVAYALLQAVAFQWLVLYPFAHLMLVGLIDAIFFYLLSLLLRKVVKYGNFDTLELHQRLLNWVALGVLFVVLWAVLSYFSSRLVLGDEAIKMLPMKVFIAFIMYLIVVQLFRMNLAKKEFTEPIDEEPDEVLPVSDITETREFQPLERIVVKTGQKINVISVLDVVYFQAEGDYVRIVTQSDRFLKEDTMKFFQEHLPENRFVRVHRSYLVNIEKILRVELYEKQSHQLSLSNGDKLKISASGYKRLREALNL